MVRIFSNGPRFLTVFNNKIYFICNESENDNSELWETDGTSVGTKIVKGNSNSSGTFFGYSQESPNGLTAFNGKLYFGAGLNDVSGKELWVSDGTSQGTELFKDIFPGSKSSYPQFFMEYNNKLFFTADNGGANGQELWDK